MKGGIELSIKWFGQTMDEAITFFLENSTFRIFTNSSISCITLIAKLNSGIESPFISIDSLDFAGSISSLLLKIMPSTDVILAPGIMADKASIPGRIKSYDGIEINSYATIERETTIQKDIFRKSIISPISYLDGLCPALLHVINPLPDKKSWKTKFLNGKKIIPRKDKPHMNEIVLINQIFSAVNSIGNKETNVSIIFMEFMEGYDTLYNLKGSPNYNMYQQMALYQLHQLHLSGYVHNDLHLGNIMVHPSIPYFTATKNPEYLGIIKIIDFGRTAPLFQSEKLLIQSPTYDYNLIAKEKLFQNIFGEASVLSKDVSSLLKAIIISYSNKRKEIIKSILQPRLKPFYDFKSIPETQRKPDNLLRVLFPASSYGGLLAKTNYINDTKDSLQYIMMKENTSETSEYASESIKSIFDFDPSYDWDAGRPIVGNTLSAEEEKMTIEDFKSRFNGVLMQNDTEKTFNISQFLKENLVATTTKGGKHKRYNKFKSKKNKTHKKRKSSKYHRSKSHSSKLHRKKTNKKYKNRC